ncbi:redox-sensing transcriptional repressor Rex [Miniphocaeibacter halophilus]|uniref:Redox-sensing transcriptional repressor Rex n=1 Tax=Miniphocaeibacter halophilus TaxID=2931922 RepID=A0AC61MRD8_9FIRM|nr:redox-sensing transcriptional repressor Rex [Miniphocaeibacter halophilus]QQK07469.1 redox-sensing transcriptional repressor Rex [Miniphocaeibacter halophilus]
MSEKPRVSLAVVKRLPKYYRYLGLIADKGIIRVSSQELSKITGLTASQIRQDLNHFGGFGQQGYGYNVEELKSEIEKIIGIDKSYKAIIVGMGNIGQAIYKYRGFNEASGFKIVGLFDKDKNTIGRTMSGIKVNDIKNINKFLQKEDVDIAVVAVPADSAQEVCDILVEGNVKGIWNFAPIDLKLPKDVVLENVHLDESLFTLTYYMNNLKDYPGTKN